MNKYERALIAYPWCVCGFDDYWQFCVYGKRFLKTNELKCIE